MGNLLKEVISKKGFRLSNSRPIAAVSWEGSLHGYRGPDNTSRVFGIDLFSVLTERSGEYLKVRHIAPIDYMGSRYTPNVRQLDSFEFRSLIDRRGGYTDPSVLGLDMLLISDNSRVVNGLDNKFARIKVDDLSGTKQFDTLETFISPEDFTRTIVYNKILVNFIKPEINRLYGIKSWGR